VSAAGRKNPMDSTLDFFGWLKKRREEGLHERRKEGGEERVYVYK
jgi:hypothetical protein